MGPIYLVTVIPTILDLPEQDCGVVAEEAANGVRINVSPNEKTITWYVGVWRNVVVMFGNDRLPSQRWRTNPAKWLLFA